MTSPRYVQLETMLSFASFIAAARDVKPVAQPLSASRSKATEDHSIMGWRYIGELSGSSTEMVDVTFSAVTFSAGAVA